METLNQKGMERSTYSKLNLAAWMEADQCWGSRPRHKPLLINYIQTFSLELVKEILQCF